MRRWKAERWVHTLKTARAPWADADGRWLPTLVSRDHRLTLDLGAAAVQRPGKEKKLLLPLFEQGADVLGPRMNVQHQCSESLEFAPCTMTCPQEAGFSMVLSQYSNWPVSCRAAHEAFPLWQRSPAQPGSVESGGSEV